MTPQNNQENLENIDQNTECNGKNDTADMLMKFHKIKVMGTATVGPKGQIVIPKAARDSANISSGDMMLMFTKEDKMISMIKLQDVNDFLDTIEKDFGRMREMFSQVQK